MNEPNPITRYVNVLQKGEAENQNLFYVIQKIKVAFNKERSEKHLAVAK
ncbi:hypothetical protein [Acinetobacter baumannii]|nr:hypothetical protein [Acinetobacter baumannii]